MAETTIHADVLDVKEINSNNFVGTIVKFWELYDKNGQQGKRLWTAWFTSDQTINVKQGDFIKVTGDISCSIGKYTPKGESQERQTVNYSLNNCRIVQLEKTPLGDPAPTPASELEFPF